MGQQSTAAASVGIPSPHSGIDWRVIYPPFPLGNAAAFGHAKPTGQKPKPGGAVQTQIRREILAAEAKRLRDQRNSKAASICEAELRAATHQALRAEIERAAAPTAAINRGEMNQ